MCVVCHGYLYMRINKHLVLVDCGRTMSSVPCIRVPCIRALLFVVPCIRGPASFRVLFSCYPASGALHCSGCYFSYSLVVSFRSSCRTSFLSFSCRTGSDKPSFSTRNSNLLSYLIYSYIVNVILQRCVSCLLMC